MPEGKLSGDSFGGNPCYGDCCVLGENVDLTDGKMKKMLEVLEFKEIAQDVCPWLLSMCSFPLNF